MHFSAKLELTDATPGRWSSVFFKKLEEQRFDVFFGHYRYRLADHGDAIRIREKYIVVCNDLIPRQMDVFNI